MPVTVIHTLGWSFVSWPTTSVKAEGRQVGITVSFSATKINSVDHHSTKNCQSAHNTWAADRSTVTAGDGIDTM